MYKIRTHSYNYGKDQIVLPPSWSFRKKERRINRKSVVFWVFYCLVTTAFLSFVFNNGV